jgi:hypothetical protein
MIPWSAIGGVASIAFGLYLLGVHVPQAVWWAPWASCAGGALLLVSAALRALLG